MLDDKFIGIIVSCFHTSSSSSARDSKIDDALNPSSRAASSLLSSASRKSMGSVKVICFQAREKEKYNIVDASLGEATGQVNDLSGTRESNISGTISDNENRDEEDTGNAEYYASLSKTTHPNIASPERVLLIHASQNEQVANSTGLTDLKARCCQQSSLFGCGTGSTPTAHSNEHYHIHIPMSIWHPVRLKQNG